MRWKMADKWLEPVKNQHVGDSGKMRCEGERRNIWPFFEFQSQIVGLACVITRDSNSRVTFPPLLGHEAASASRPCVGFASFQVWLSMLPPLAHLSKPPAPTSSLLALHRVDPSLASFHVVVGGLLSRNPSGQLETKENRRFPFLIDPPWDPVRPEDTDEWERHPPD